MSTRNELSLICQVKEGRLDPSPEQKAMVRAFLNSVNRSDVSVRISKPRKVRSLSQNSYYWAVPLAMIAAQTGQSAEEVHYFLKCEFLPPKVIRLGTREVEIRKTTTDLTTQEFELYLIKVRSWAAQELGLVIPLPNEM